MSQFLDLGNASIEYDTEDVKNVIFNGKPVEPEEFDLLEAWTDYRMQKAKKEAQEEYAAERAERIAMDITDMAIEMARTRQI